MEKAFVSWSGGKDCCLACYRAGAVGLQICYLLNMITDDGQQSRSHGLHSKWLQMQAQAMGIPLMQRPATTANYEAKFVEALTILKRKGVTTGIFGDIDFNAHREWIDRVCHKSGIKPVLPLWLENQNKLMNEFLSSGFETVVVATRADRLGEEWLGRKVDSVFMAELAELGNVTPCGEAGEYHTLVVNGPVFRKRLNITGSNKVSRDGRWFLNIVKCELR